MRFIRNGDLFQRRTLKATRKAVFAGVFLGRSSCKELLNIVKYIYMNKRYRNVIGITLLIAVALALIVGVAVVAVRAKSNAEERVYFIDTAPVDYTAAENAVYVLKFRNAVASYLAPVSEELSLGDLADRLLNAMSKARIPAQKLGGMADAINKYSLSGIGGSVDGWDLTEEQFIAILTKSGFSYVNEFLNSFFDESGLTGEEFGTFLYHYLDLYGSSDYKLALNAVGKDIFIQFMSCTVYFITSVNDVGSGEGQYIDDYILEAAFYQLGSVFLNAVDAAGAEVLERALGLQFSVGETQDNYEEINAYLGALNGKTGTVIAMIGCILRSASANAIGECRSYAETGGDDELIYSQILAAKEALDGLRQFTERYDGALGNDLFEIKEEMYTYVENITLAQAIITGSDMEALAEALDDMHSRMNAFADSLAYLATLDYTREDIAALDETAKEALVEQAKNMSVLASDADYLFSEIIIMWITTRMNEMATA